MLPSKSDKDQSDLLDLFLVTAPGLELIALRELRSWVPQVVAATVQGGVTCQLPMGVGLSLNRVLKTPTRILVRLADFGCRDFPKLFRKTSNLPWERWLGDVTHVEFQASTHTSRLRIKKRIEETCADGFRAHLKKAAGTQAKPAPASGQGPAASAGAITIYVRFVDDVCTISLDTSGELLHKRGLRPLTAEAPLRETIAASLLLMLEEAGASSPESTKPVELVDPMMGGGTFLIEARELRRPVSSRGFAFESLKPLADAEKAAGLPSCSQPSVIGSFVGYESDEKTWKAAKENIGEGTARIFREDFFSAKPLEEGPRRWLIANPPYGERLEVKGSLAAFYSRLFKQAEAVARPERALFLLPAKIPGGRLEIPAAWVKQDELRFQNGGIPVVAHLFTRR